MTDYFGKLMDDSFAAHKQTENTLIKINAALRQSRATLINIMGHCPVQNCTVAKRCRNCHEAEKALAAIDNIYGREIKP